MSDASYQTVRAKLQECIDEFKRQIGYSGGIEISEPHYRFHFVSNPKSETQWPSADEPGCYVFFSTKPDPSGQLLYVGKGSRYMGNRMWNPFGRWRKAHEPLSLPFPNAEPWVISHEAGFVAVKVPQDHWWLAPALEGFLINCFRDKEPLENKRFR